MKEYIHADNMPHLADLFSEISTIIVVPDARTFSMDIIDAAEDIEYLDWSDDELLDMSDDEMDAIFNPDVLNRIYELAPDRLTDMQKGIIREEYRQKYIISRSDVVDALNKLHSCNDIYVYPRAKNKKFIKQYNLSTRDQLDIVHSLKISDYANSTGNIDEDEYFGDELIVFTPKLYIDKVETELVVYVKIDLTRRMNDDSTFAIISLHQDE